MRLIVAHLDHMSRGADSTCDAAFVSALAERWGVSCTIERRDVPALAEQYGLAFEETARRVRYTFLYETALREGMGKIAVGHHADDQAETVLMHLLRGAGPAGLRGMLPATRITEYRMLEPFLGADDSAGKTGLADHGAAPVVIRPLLTTWRQEIEAYCRQHYLTPRFDLSNLDTTYFRNRLRHDLLPILETYNPNVRQRLVNTAAVVAADYALLEELHARAYTGTVREGDADHIVFDLVAWREQPLSLQRSLLREGVYALRRSLRDVDFVHVECAREVALNGQTGAQATLPGGLMLTVGYDVLTIASSDFMVGSKDQPVLWSDLPVAVAVPGITRLPGSDWVLSAELQSWTDASSVDFAASPWEAWIDADGVQGPLALRTRRPGDRFAPQGMAGRRVKLSDFMINLKMPLPYRDQAPLLADDHAIIWVCGYRVAEDVAVGERTRRVLHLCLRVAP